MWRRPTVRSGAIRGCSSIEIQALGLCSAIATSCAADVIGLYVGCVKQAAPHVFIHAVVEGLTIAPKVAQSCGFSADFAF
jgi:hypothetical protein